MDRRRFKNRVVMEVCNTDGNMIEGSKSDILYLIQFNPMYDDDWYQSIVCDKLDPIHSCLTVHPIFPLFHLIPLFL